jgi:hypothetical protein
LRSLGRPATRSSRADAALGDLVKIVERARLLLAPSHVLEHPDRRDSVAWVDLRVPGDPFEDRDPLLAAQRLLRSFFTATCVAVVGYAWSPSPTFPPVLRR